MNPVTFELISAEEVQARKPQGLFDGLLSGHTAVLLQDVQDHPNKYDSKLLPLLEQLISGKKRSDLTPEESELLNRGTLDFVTYVPKEEKKEVERLKPKLASARQSDDFDLFDEEETEDTFDMPEDLKPYWWK